MMFRTRSLPLFLALSVAAHAALLAAWRPDRAQDVTEHGASALGDGTLTVALGVHRSPMAAGDRDSLPQRDTAITTDTPMATAKQSPDTRKTTNGNAVTIESHEASASPAVRNFLLGKVSTELARYFQYPAIARERGWEGKVVLGFSLQADGHLNGIHIARSSGYHVLDESARDALGKVSAIADARQWLQGHTIDMQLPVIYRLLDR